MIIRIMGLGQYKVPSSLFDELNAIDNRIVEHVTKGNEKTYKQDLAALISKIKQNGKVLGAEEIVESDIIVPPEDLTFEEAKDVFTGSGIFED
ncbi:PspA-associated protein PspAA [Methanomethylovorans sp.]|uniref:PspA-associated protein PspAA n=1 Tax=Methanomethylovorans sp. TaxID=2758717 RepID=UPI003D11D8F2